jgi:hypothetical protein
LFEVYLLCLPAEGRADGVRRWAETGSRWRTILHKDQLDLFAGLRAGLADVGALGAISIAFTSTCTLALWGVLLSTPDDHWLRGILTGLFPPLISVLFLCLIAEAV